jgi:ATP-binding cassette subfamily G (WHITE) protein 2 (SNQ2)
MSFTELSWQHANSHRRPGAGCSTFLKIIGNQRFGYDEITGDVSYGGTDAGEMGKKYRSEVLYNPEDDLHYATLKVKDTLRFALKTRTPGKESRKEGESRKDYVNEFLRVVTKLFWIEHTLGTKVGNELIRGVSGGEKKRVSIAEAMVTKASVQAWDNSTRGLDASTALEYVQSLRSLTNMAQISTHPRGSLLLLWSNREGRGLLQEPRLRKARAMDDERFSDFRHR